MKNVAKFFKFVAGLMVVSAFVGCEIGLGQALDLEAPEVTVTSPAKFSYQKLNFKFTGTCKDNIGVTNVTISNKETGKVYGYANISGNDWEYNISLTEEEEGEITFLIQANDEAGNSSTKSTRSLNLLVDQNAPVAKSWYIERGVNINSYLKTKEELEATDLNLAVNKDVPQNQKFVIHGDFYDAMGIDTITIKLFDETISDTVPVIEKTVNADPASSQFIGNGKSIFTPAFEFTHDELVAANTNLKSGKHYLRIKYYTKDNNTENNYNENTVDTEKYVFWYPESDSPGIQQTQIKDGKLRASVGSTIPIDFFDDDALKEVYAYLKNSITGTPEEYAESLRKNSSVRNAVKTLDANETKSEETSLNDSTRDYPIQIKCPEVPAKMFLVTFAKDINNEWNARVIPVEVTDENKPLLFIEKPTENTIPDIETGTTDQFKFTGYSLDTKGSNYIKLVYIPDSLNYSSSAAKEARALDLLTQYKDDRTAKKLVGQGEIIWCYEFTENNITLDNWNKQSFEIAMNLLTDFKKPNGESAAKDIKFFEVMIVDTDGNSIPKTFMLNGDSSLPSIDIKSPEKELDVHDYTQQDLKIQFKGVKSSGLAMDNDDYMVTTKIGSQTYKYKKGSDLTVDANGYANVTISKELLSTWAETEAQPTFTFYASDILGNGAAANEDDRPGVGQRSVILSPRPVINSITVDKNNGTYKKGDVLKFKVSFSKQIKVTGTPRLILKYSASDSIPKYATYTDGSGSNTLSFTFTVPEGAVSDKLICEGFDVESEDKFASGIRIQATELGEGDIYTSLANAEVLKNKVIKLDGVAPFIESIAVSSADGNNFCTVGKQIKAAVKMSEKILVSGSPVLKLSTSTSTEDVSFTFQKMEDDTITFVHVVTNTDKQGVLKYNIAKCLSDSEAFVADNNGNLLKLASTGVNKDTSVVIDYTAPSSAPTTNITETSYNTDKDIVLSNYENDAVLYFSIDDGISWYDYSSTEGQAKKHLSNGTYKIKTKQADKAGNMSPVSETQTVVINSEFSPIASVTIDKPAGNYKKDTEFTFTVHFERKVKVTNSEDIRLKFSNTTGAKVTSEYINVEVPTAADRMATEFKFKYKVSGTDSFNGVKFEELLFANTVKDSFGNSPSPLSLTSENCSMFNEEGVGLRKDIVLDGVVPNIVVYGTPDGGINSGTDNTKGNFVIELTFNEEVHKEEGQIILQRKGNWAIPPVLSDKEFVSIYNKLSPANREILMKTTTGNGSDISKDAKDAKTGQPVGPYKKITHGLKVESSKYVPDTGTKYVLDFKYDLVENLQGDTTVSDIRNALKSIDYDKLTVDVQSNNVIIKNNADGTCKVSIKFAKDVPDGREWLLIIPPKAFRDETENFYKGMNLDQLSDSTITDAQKAASDKYSFWSNNVAVPVIRLDRYSHGMGAVESDSSGKSPVTILAGDRKYTNTISYNSGRKIAPTGYARVRIDCETTGATIKYKTIAGGSASIAKDNGSSGLTTELTFGKASEVSAAGKKSEITDISTTSLDGVPLASMTNTYTTGNYVVIGDGSYLTARKDYIVAKATKTGFETSATGKEGIFKTVVYCALNANNGINIEGGTAPGGEPSVSGFPLRDGTSHQETSPYSKNSYKISSLNHDVWVSYEIVSTDYAILLTDTNHSKAYPLGSYGNGVYVTQMTWE